MNLFKGLRGKLFFWYATSLLAVTLYFYLAVHLFSLAYGNILFIILLIVLALVGLFIIRKMTNELTRLSEKIRTITSQNLDQRITDIASKDEIGELADAFNHLLSRLHEAFTRERQFIGDVAHELKTPLATERSTIEVLLSKKRTNEEYQKATADLLIDNQKLTNTVSDVLDLAWAEADKTNMVTEKTNLTEVLDELHEIATQLGMRKKLQAVKRLEKDVYVTGSRDKIFRALLNIVDNAIKYTAKGTISLTLTQDHNLVTVKVKDTGEGIAEEDILHIFDRFYRGYKSHRVDGTGLGLAIAHSIITALKGILTVKNNVERGATFTVTFPEAKS
ncbi:MAG: HAMP domain-containing sensor histidine kinase [Patescibacteria group bacterium]